MSKKEINIVNQLGLKGFFKTYEFSNLKRHIILAIVLTILYFIILFISKLDVKTQIDKILNLGIDILPNLLGFLLGGYAILISFGSVRFLKMVTKVVEGQKTSLFQKTSLNFTLSIFVNCVALLFVFFTKIISDLNYTISCFIGSDLVYIFNFIVIFVLVFLLLFTIILLPQLLFNVYNFATVYGALMQDEDDSSE